MVRSPFGHDFERYLEQLSNVRPMYQNNQKTKPEDQRSDLKANLNQSRLE